MSWLPGGGAARSSNWWTLRSVAAGCGSRELRHEALRHDFEAGEDEWAQYALSDELQVQLARACKGRARAQPTRPGGWPTPSRPGRWPGWGRCSPSSKGTGRRWSSRPGRSHTTASRRSRCAVPCSCASGGSCPAPRCPQRCRRRSRRPPRRRGRRWRAWIGAHRRGVTAAVLLSVTTGAGVVLEALAARSVLDAGTGGGRLALLAVAIAGVAAVGTSGAAIALGLGRGLNATCARACSSPPPAWATATCARDRSGTSPSGARDAARAERRRAGGHGAAAGRRGGGRLGRGDGPRPGDGPGRPCAARGRDRGSRARRPATAGAGPARADAVGSPGPPTRRRPPRRRAHPAPARAGGPDRMQTPLIARWAAPLARCRTGWPRSRLEPSSRLPGGRRRRLARVSNGARDATALVVAALVLLATSALQELLVLARSLIPTRNALARLAEPLALPPHDPPPRAAAHRRSGVALRFEDAGVMLSGRRVLDGVSLSVKPGEHVAVVGPSGAGKSTLVAALAGWLDLASGTILVDGRPLAGTALSELRSATAWSSGEVRLWDTGAVANVRYGQADDAPASGRGSRVSAGRTALNPTRVRAVRAWTRRPPSGCVSRGRSDARTPGWRYWTRRSAGCRRTRGVRCSRRAARAGSTPRCCASPTTSRRRARSPACW